MDNIKSSTKNELSFGHTMIKKELSQLKEPEEFSRAVSQFGKDIYTQKEQNKKKKQCKARPYDRLTCEICGKDYTRCNKGKHEVTQFHKIYANMNANLKKALLGI